MSYIFERKWSPLDISLNPARENSYNNLLSWAESFDILGSDDRDLAIDEFADHLLEFTRDRDIFERITDEYKDNMSLAGFMQSDIREVVLYIMQKTGHISNDELKFFILATFARENIDILEYEELRFHFAEKVEPGIFEDRETALNFLAYMADRSSELYGKRLIDHFCYRLVWIDKEPELSEAFFNSEEGLIVRTSETVDWFCGDVDRMNVGYSYKDVFRRLLEGYRRDERYLEYVDNPELAVRAAFNRFQEGLG